MRRARGDELAEALLKALREGVEGMAVDADDYVLVVEVDTAAGEFEGALVADCLVVEFGGYIDDGGRPRVRWATYYP